jgi:hypothetical protein
MNRPSYDEKDINYQADTLTSPGDQEKGFGEVALDEAEDSFAQDPFSPFDDLPDEREWVLTFRAVFIGLCCGTIVNASNVYLGLKSGWTFGANLFGAIAGFAIIESVSTRLRKTSPSWVAALDPGKTTLSRQRRWLPVVCRMSLCQRIQRCIS